MFNFSSSDGSSSIGSDADHNKKNPFLTAKQAASKLSKAFGMTHDQENMMAYEIETCKDDPMLVISVDPNWINSNGQAAANQILDFIATWPNLPIANRRDSRMNHVLYHFVEPGDIMACRHDLLQQFPHAFAFSQATIIEMQNHGIPASLLQALNRTPFARVGIIHKINLYDNDASEDMDFFFR